MEEKKNIDVHIRWGPVSEFKLTDKFIEQYEGKEPEWGPIGKVVYYRTYSRQTENNRTEEYWQTLRRVVEGTFTIQKTHCDMLGLPWNQMKAQKSAQIMYNKMWEFKFLPPGRGLWAMGTDYIYQHGSAALNNCGFASTKDIATDFSGPFIFLMDMSMLGVGVGGDTKGANSVKIKQPKIGDYTFVVEDSREGWVKLIQTIIDSYVGADVMPKTIDYSKIRKKGDQIKGFGGTSSGSKPLEECVENIKEVLDPLVGELITSTAIVDIFNYLGKCVVAGNIRRSAEIMLGDETDLEFLSLKDPKLHKKELMDRRWASNNSIIATVGMNYSKTAEMTAKNGEPGYLWLQNAREYSRMGDAPDHIDSLVDGVNPCGEQPLESYELCNLVETFPSLHESKEEFLDTLKYAYMYAKSVTLLPTHNLRTNAVMLRNRRIGTSMSGVIQAFTRHGKRNLLSWAEVGYTRILELDKVYSRWLCVPESIKVTTIKPSGTVSQLPGVTPGIHYPHSEYYIRNVRFGESPLIETLRQSGYVVEKDKYDTNAFVVSFPVKEKYFERCKKEVSLWEQLENAAQLQQLWSDNAVSVTVTFAKEEATSIKYALELYEKRLKSVSFLPIEHDYEQAPYIEISKEKYDSMIGKIKKIKLKEFSGSDEGRKYCDNEKCEL